MRTLHDLLLEQFKVRTRLREYPNNVTSVGTQAVLIARNNPNRLGFVVSNLHDTNKLYIGFNHEVSTTRGLPIDPGGTATWVWDEDFDCVGWGFWAIATGVNTPIYCYEITTA